MNDGDVFKTNSCGMIKVVKYVTSVDVHVMFLDSGFVTSARAGDIRSGRVKDKTKPSVCGVGFIGVGRFTPTFKGKSTKQYRVWKTMLQRCYSKNRIKRYPCYSGCVVCDDWLNFQNFAEWYTENYPADGGDYDLDKDVLSGKRKVYSPMTCKFITKADNVSFSKRGVFFVESPEGKVLRIGNMKRFCEANGLHPGAMSAVASGKLRYHKGFKRLTPEQKKGLGL